MKQEEANLIPGMIEPVERNLLFRTASTLAFQAGDNVVEFGTFFGRSTNCIAQGLSANATFGGRGRFQAFDSFECDEDGGFAPHVLNLSRQAKVDRLLIKQGRRINFRPIFEHFLQSYIESGIVETVQAELSQSMPPEGSILMMHIDSPKFYEEFRTILFRFLPRTRIDATIIFQDFFYHWSASLIAVIGLMLKAGYLRVVESAASSLACRLVVPIDLATATEIDLAMQDERQTPRLIDAAYEIVSAGRIDRRDQFLPRLILAKIQWLYEQGRHKEATKVMLAYFKSGGKLHPGLFNDFVEMMSQGFNTRRGYEKDRA